MKNFIRRFLGIEALAAHQVHLYDLVREIERDTKRQSQLLGAITPGLGRIIGKLDPMYARDELDPERRKESEDIGEQVMKKLVGEHIERDKYK